MCYLSGSGKNVTQVLGLDQSVFAVKLDARRAVLETDMITTRVANKILHLNNNLRNDVNQLRQQGSLLGIRRSKAHEYVFPAFQFDFTNGDMHFAVVEVNQLLGALEDPWGVASWWIEPHARLKDGESPKDLIGYPDGERHLLTLAHTLVGGEILYRIPSPELLL